MLGRGSCRVGAAMRWEDKPLAKAVFAGNVKRAAKLLEQVPASLNSSLDPEVDCSTPLRAACQQGYTRMAAMLLGKGAQTGIVDPSGTPSCTQPAGRTTEEWWASCSIKALRWT